MVHLNLNEIKITKLYVHPEKIFNYKFKPEISKIVSMWFGLIKEKEITQYEGWYDNENYHHIFSVKSVERMKKEKELKDIEGVLTYSPYIVVVDSENMHYKEYFENDDEMYERLNEFRIEAKCDFFCVGND
jgi:hypothetical protein